MLDCILILFQLVNFILLGLLHSLTTSFSRRHLFLSKSIKMFWVVSGQTRDRPPRHQVEEHPRQGRRQLRHRRLRTGQLPPSASLDSAVLLPTVPDILLSKNCLKEGFYS